MQVVPRQAFTLAHVSDPHLGPLPRLPLGEWNLKRALGAINWHRKRHRQHIRSVWVEILADLKASAPDHVALTGDLVNLGTPAEHAAAAQWLPDVGPPDRVTVVPGNHDIYCNLSNDIGIERWRPYMTGDDGGSLPAAVFPFVRRRGPVCLIALNSACPTPVAVAAGRLGHAQIEATGNYLRKAGAEGLFRCVLIHHPPLPGQTTPRRALGDAAEFSRVLRAAGVELVLHGHNHLDMSTRLDTSDGTALVDGIASASMAEGMHYDAARWALYRIAETDEGWRIEKQVRGVEAGRIREVGRTLLDLPRRRQAHA